MPRATTTHASRGALLTAFGNPGHDLSLEGGMLDLFAQCVSLGSELGRLRIELLLLDAVEVGWPLAALGQLLKAALSAHLCSQGASREDSGLLAPRSAG